MKSREEKYWVAFPPLAHYSTPQYSTHGLRPISTNNFGLLIAYVLPGFTCLWGLSYVSGTVRSWLSTTPTDAPTVGGFLYVTLASIAPGLTVSTIRWAVIDTIHHRTGIPRPEWDFSHLQEKVAAFEALVEIHYRYHQFNAGVFLSLLFAYGARRFSLGFWSTPIGWLDFAFALIELIFFVGSRDSFNKYVVRGNMLLGTGIQPKGVAQKKGSTATHEEEADDPAKSVVGH